MNNEINGLQGTAFGTTISANKTAKNQKADNDGSIFNSNNKAKEKQDPFQAGEDLSSLLDQVAELPELPEPPEMTTVTDLAVPIEPTEPPAEPPDIATVIDSEPTDDGETNKADNNRESSHVELAKRRHEIMKEMQEAELSSLEQSRENREAARTAMWNMINNEDDE